MSKKHSEPSLAKRKPVVPKSARFTGGAPLDPAKSPVFVSREGRKFFDALLKDPGRFHIMARKATTGRA